ncbi:MAG: type IV-A pilus assembly ATPase PilB [Zetaproteobacteria bacterium]|nr:type IV-A pilus assembly ATPase PilB [Pseudobdellovibrionaceae bacterium]
MLTLQELLTKEAQLSPEDYKRAEERAKSDKCPIIFTLEKSNLIDADKLLDLFSQYYKLEKIDLQKVTIDPKILSLVPKDIAKKHFVLPIEKVGNNIVLAMGNPKDLQAIDAVRFKSKLLPKPVVASVVKILDAIEKFYSSVDLKEMKMSGSSSKTNGDSGKMRTVIGEGVGDKDDGPIIKLVNDVLIQCKETGASDIHIEAYEESLRVRLRIDGALKEIVKPPLGMKGALISRIKIMSGLNIAETRLPQDGAINVTVGKDPIDFRVNTLPTVHGEKIVMRILDKSNLQVDMTQLGFESYQLKDFQGAINSPNGMVLVTGPTGSGKTTTLYSALQELNRESSNVMTSEDPVEYSLSGINQVQMKPDIGLDFSAALRAFLRQDPDIIMVGEIRDLETAEIAMKAALTGHLVLSTLHTNSAPDTISRLLNMGAAPFNLVAALNGITAQRLMRRICSECKEVDQNVTPELLTELGLPEKFASKVQVYKGAGCGTCGQSGYKGRVAVHEVLILKEAVKRSILNGAAAVDIKKVAMKEGMRSLRQSAIAKMIQGLTTIEEVIKSTSSDND